MFRKVSLLTQDDGTVPTGKMYRFIWAIKTDAPMPRELSNASGVFDPVQLLQRHHHLFQRRVAGPLAQAVDRGVDVGRAAPSGGEGVGGRQTQIVVGVHFQFEIQRRPQALEDRQHAKRFHNPQRVSKAEPPRSGMLSSFSGLQ